MTSLRFQNCQLTMDYQVFALLEYCIIRGFTSLCANRILFAQKESCLRKKNHFKNLQFYYCLRFLRILLSLRKQNLSNFLQSCDYFDLRRRVIWLHFFLRRAKFIFTFSHGYLEFQSTAARATVCTILLTIITLAKLQIIII